MTSRTKSLTHAENERLREVLARIVAKRGSQRAAADALGVTQATVSDFLSRKRGAGVRLVRALALLDAEAAKMLGEQPSERYPNREAAIGIMAGTWSDETIAALRTVAFLRAEDPAVSEWIRLGEQIHGMAE